MDADSNEASTKAATSEQLLDRRGGGETISSYTSFREEEGVGGDGERPRNPFPEGLQGERPLGHKRGEHHDCLVSSSIYSEQDSCCDDIDHSVRLVGILDVECGL